MSQLVDRHIRREQEKSLLPFTAEAGVQFEDRAMIYPWRHDQLQPASYDVRLGARVRTEYGVEYDLSQEHWQEAGWKMSPGQLLLGHTEEHFRIPAHLAARVEGKSSVGRRGLAVHVTAGFIDPGFNGQITLELVNHSQVKGFTLRPGLLIAQVTFHRLTDMPERLYGDPALGSHYQGQTGPTPAAKGIYD